MNYKNLILTVLILLICSTAHAGYYVFHSGETITGKSVCGKACRIRPDSLSIDKATFDSITRWHKVVNDVVVLMTQAEKDAIIQAGVNEQKAAETARIDSGNITMNELIDALIAKGVISLTKKQITDQVKINEGL